MLARLPNLTVIRLWIALLVAAVGLQAAQPLAAPLERTHGSAFSAATVDVALGPQRRGDASQVAEVHAPALPVNPCAAQPCLRLASLAEANPVRPRSTGPPPIAILDRQPAPRAPPTA